MKVICISCFNFYSTRMESVLEYFREKGCETLYIISDFNHYYKKKYNAKLDNTIQIKVPEYKNNISPVRLWSHFVFTNKVYKILHKEKPDIVYCIVPPNLLVERIVKYKREFGAKIILDCFDTWPESFPIKKYEKLLRFPFKIWRNMRDKHIEGADMVITPSYDGKTYLKKLHPNIQIRVVKPLEKIGKIPSYKFETDNEFTFCYIGNINYITNIDLGVELLSKLARNKKVTLHIIGAGKNLREFVNELNKFNVNVVEHGVIFDEIKKNEIFKQCDFGLNIPHKEVNSTMALKFIEYMRVGLPVVNAGLGDSHEIVAMKKIGINIDEDNLEYVVKELCEIKNKGLEEMHRNCVNYYKQIYDENVIDDCLNMIINEPA